MNQHSLDKQGSLKLVIPGLCLVEALWNVLWLLDFTIDVPPYRMKEN